MIINSHDLLAGLGSPQVADDHLGEAHGAPPFAQFLTQDAEIPAALAAFLAPFSQSPTRPLPGLLRLSDLPFDPLALADAPGIELTEQESRVLDDILAALQTLFPGLMFDLSGIPPTTVAEGGGAFPVPEEGRENAAGLSALGGVSLLAAPAQSVAATDGAGEVDVSPSLQASTIASIPVSTAAGTIVPGGSQASAANAGYQGAGLETSGATPLVAEQSAPESPQVLPDSEAFASKNADQTRSSTSPTVSPVAIPPQEDTVTLPTDLQEAQPDDLAATLVAEPWQQAGQRGSADTGDDPSPARQGQTSVPAHVLPETVSSTPFTDTSRASVDEAEPQRGAALPSAAEPLRYVPTARGTVLLQLEPPELGTLLVQVRQLHAHLTASFWAESSEVRALLQAHFPALNQVLSQQGVSTQQISLQLGSGDAFAGQFGQSAQQHGATQTFAHGDRDEGSAGRRRDLGRSATPHRPGDGHVDIRI